MRRALIVTWACVASGATLGCDRQTDQALAGNAQTAVVAQVVARVGGRAIGAASVRERMALDRVSAESAVDALIEEELLLQETKREGLTEDPEAARRVDRMMVRALLHDLEQENNPEGLPAKQVREDFEQNREKFQILERRASWHVLAKADTSEARRIAASVLAEARRAEDPTEVFERYAEGAADALDVPVVVEELPAITVNASIEKPYKDALFDAKSTGPLREPVLTSYGWHAIIVTDIQPGEARSLRDVEDEIRERLSRKQRFEKLVEVIRALEAEGLVTENEPVVERLLTVQELPKHAE